jgi:hypothetical protein
VVNLRWPGMWAVCVAGVALREDWAGLLLRVLLMRSGGCGVQCNLHKNTTGMMSLKTEYVRCAMR